MADQPRQVCPRCSGSAFHAVYTDVPACWVNDPQPPRVTLLRCKTCRKLSWAPPQKPRRDHAIETLRPVR